MKRLRDIQKRFEESSTPGFVRVWAPGSADWSDVEFLLNEVERLKRLSARCFKHAGPCQDPHHKTLEDCMAYDWLCRGKSD